MIRRSTAVRSVPVIRFRAGELHVAVAAAAVDVISVSAQDAGAAGEVAGVMHIASLMGEGSRPATPAQRHLRLRDGAAAVDLVVDGPVAMANLTVQDILPIKHGLARTGFVLGFARLGGEVVALLDIPSLVAAHRRAAPAGPGPEDPARPVDRELREPT